MSRNGVKNEVEMELKMESKMESKWNKIGVQNEVEIFYCATERESTEQEKVERHKKIC